MATDHSRPYTLPNGQQTDSLFTYVTAWRDDLAKPICDAFGLGLVSFGSVGDSTKPMSVLVCNLGSPHHNTEIPLWLAQRMLMHINRAKPLHPSEYPELMDAAERLATTTPTQIDDAKQALLDVIARVYATSSAK